MTRLLIPLIALLSASLWAQNSLEIIRGSYGSGRSQADVTEKLRSYVVNGGIHIEITPEVLGVPAAPGRRGAALTVVYSVGGPRRTLRLLDNDFLKLGNAPADPVRAGAAVSPSGFEISRALYGDGPRMKDVTSILQSRISSGQLEIPVTNEALGGDPAPAVKKHIVVDYRVNGAPFTVSLAEGGTLRLPPPGSVPVGPAVVSQLKILKATYGLTGRRRASRDVTAELSSRVANGTLDLTVAPTLFGSDPAPGFAKMLNVEYELNGQRQIAAVRDGEALRLGAASPSPSAPSPAIVAAPVLRIISGTYGPAAEAENARRRRQPARRTVDVSSALAARVEDNELNIRVEPELLGGDPAPGVLKTLTIEYELDGKRATFTAKDHEPVFLPPVTSLTVISATYGVPGRSVDATNAVRTRLSNNQLEVLVTDSSLGGDPAPGIVKTLTVVYERNGRRRIATAEDGQTMRLPGHDSSAPIVTGTVVTPGAVTATPLPAVISQESTRSRAACLYSLPNYGGEAVCLPPGQASAALANWRSGFRSVRMNGAAAVELFEMSNYGGRSHTVTADTADLLQAPGNWWRYESAAPVQSMRVR